MQLKKNVACNYILVTCDTCNCIRQVIKKYFCIGDFKFWKHFKINKGEIEEEVQSKEHEQLPKKQFRVLKFQKPLETCAM